MDWTSAIDIYCERTSAGFWAEPLNAWSNLSFPAAACGATVLAGRRGGASAAYWVLVVLAALVGVGSFLFHTFANVWSQIADIVPIWSFVAVASLVAAGRIAGLRPGAFVLAGSVVTVSFIAAYLAATHPRGSAAPAAADPLNGSGQYLPALAALAGFAGLAALRRLPIRRRLSTATLVFAAALVFRSIDLRVCAELPAGTHFLWHLLLGLMVFLILAALLAVEPQRQRPGTQVVVP
jgi:hypothetical protein